MGYYDTKSLPIYQYLTGSSAPKYAVLDNFFQSAFGGSFLNHQWLVAAQTPVYPDHRSRPATRSTRSSVPMVTVELSVCTRRQACTGRAAHGRAGTPTSRAPRRPVSAATTP